MTDELRHFVAYHNTERMGHSLEQSDAFRVLTNKSVKPLHGNIVWLIVGEGQGERRFSLASVFRVAETGLAEQERFKNYAAGGGQRHRFDPPIPLNELDWFDEFSRSVGRFQFGVQPLKDEAQVTAFRELARNAGATFPWLDGS